MPGAMKKVGRGGALMVLLLVCCALVGQDAERAEPPATVRLEAHDGKTQFFIGERIQMDEVFQNPGKGDWTLTSNPDNVTVAPATGWMRWQGWGGSDLVFTNQLTYKPVRRPIVLNHSFVFLQPGHYEISVKTWALQPPASERGGPQPPYGTNSVGIDLAPMPPDVETELVRTLSAQIAAGGEGEERGVAAETLACLTGDEAMREKVRLVLDSTAHKQRQMNNGMAASRNLQLQLGLLQAGWIDVHHVPDRALELAMTETRYAMAGGTNVASMGMLNDQPGANPVSDKVALERHADLDRLAETLHERTGDNRRATAFFVLEHRLSARQAALVRPVAVEEFSSMDPMAQEAILSAQWKAMRGPELIPALRETLEKPPALLGYRDALKRLIELSPEMATPYVEREICSTDRYVSVKDVGALPVDTLPEVDACLAAELRVPPSKDRVNWWGGKALLAARFATVGVLPALREGWKDSDEDQAALPMLLRYAPAQFVTWMTVHPGKTQWDLGDLNLVYTSRHASFPPEFLDWLRMRLQSDSVPDVEIAGFELSTAGQREDLPLLEARLDRLRTMLRPRVGEMNGAGSDRELGAAAFLEAELLNDLRNGTGWRLSPEEAERLSNGCLSDSCRQYILPPDVER
jgi:hypothetical protein